MVDDDDDRSDWIELFNPSGTSVNLKGWALTDDPTQQTKWTFPNVTLGSREYRVVFASGKNRKILNAPLHTDFRLSREAGYLALQHRARDQLSTNHSSPAAPRRGRSCGPARAPSR